MCSEDLTLKHLLEKSQKKSGGFRLKGIKAGGGVKGTSVDKVSGTKDQVVYNCVPFILKYILLLGIYFLNWDRLLLVFCRRLQSLQLIRLL
jgi:hypothetical protein